MNCCIYVQKRSSGLCDKKGRKYSNKIANNNMNPPFYRNHQNKYRQSLQANSPQKPMHSNSKSPQSNVNQGTRDHIVDSKIYTLNSYKFIKSEPVKSSDYLPPKSGPFQRTNRSRSRDTSIRDKSNSNISNCTIQKQIQPQRNSRERTQSVSKMTELRKKISTEIAQKQKWKELNSVNQQKMMKMSNEMTKIKQRNKYLQDQTDRLSRQLNQKQKQITKLNTNIQNLNKNIKNQASQLNNMKNRDAEIQQMKNQLKKLSFDKESLAKTITALKLQSQKKNMGNLQEQNMQKSQNIVKLQREIDKLRQQLSQKALLTKNLQQSLRETQLLLYKKEGELKKTAINLSFMGRKTAMSIDDVRSKKDQQIKMIRQRYNKVNKEMKTIKDSIKESKIQKQQGRKQSKVKSIGRRVKSSKYIRGSQSEEFTFELSQQT